MISDSASFIEIWVMEVWILDVVHGVVLKKLIAYLGVQQFLYSILIRGSRCCEHVPDVCAPYLQVEGGKNPPTDIWSQLKVYKHCFYCMSTSLNSS